MAAAQAAELRGTVARMGRGNRQTYARVRGVSAFLDRDRLMEHEVAALAMAR